MAKTHKSKVKPGSNKIHDQVKRLLNSTYQIHHKESRFYLPMKMEMIYVCMKREDFEIMHNATFLGIYVYKIFPRTSIGEDDPLVIEGSVLERESNIVTEDVD